jgi:hypothetical protein
MFETEQHIASRGLFLVAREDGHTIPAEAKIVWPYLCRRS